MRVVDAGERERGVAHLQLVAAVGEVEPAGLDVGTLEVGPGQLRLVDVPLAGVGQQVADRVAQGRHVVVVGAEHEDARPLQQRAERLGHDRHRLAVGQVVAGVDHEVGLEVGQPAQPLLLAQLARRHVDVGQVQDPQRSMTGGSSGSSTVRKV